MCAGNVLYRALVIIQYLVYLESGAYEPPKVAKERTTTTYARVPSKYKFKRNTFQIWKVRIYWNWLLPYTYTDSHAQFRI